MAVCRAEGWLGIRTVEQMEGSVGFSFSLFPSPPSLGEMVASPPEGSPFVHPEEGVREGTVTPQSGVRPSGDRLLFSFLLFSSQLL